MSTDRAAWLSKRIGALATSARGLRETHISWVLLFEHEVVKFKKPVRFPFLDLSELRQRQAACQDELRLNRDLAADVYLGLSQLQPCGSEAPAEAKLEVADPADRHLEWAVRMRRLSDENRADILLERGQLKREQLRALAQRLSGFHAARVLSPEDPDASATAQREIVEQNVREVRDLRWPASAQALVERACRSVQEFAASQGELLDRRVANHRMVEGHGDLRLEHIYFEGDGAPRVIDCVEFSRRLRSCDQASDVAFLHMDLARLGNTQWADWWLGAYAAARQDWQLYEVVDFYSRHRALVRAKVALLPHGRDPAADPEAGCDYLRHAASALRSPGPLIAIGGLIGSGKSTLAQSLAAALGCAVVSSDQTRKARGASPGPQPGSPAFRGEYDPEVTREVYRLLETNARHVLDSGRSVIVDASFRSRRQRERLRSLAAKTGARLVFLECRPPHAVCRQRLALREHQATVSDARLGLFEQFVARYEPVTELPPAVHLPVDTSLPNELNVSSLCRWLERSGAEQGARLPREA